MALTLHRKRCLGALAGRDPALEDEGVERLFEGGCEPLILEDLHFLHCLASGATPLSDGPSGLDVIRILERAETQLQGLLQTVS
jgi:predicted dehydrogenase